MQILVTGGVGFIGLHTLVELYSVGHTAVVVDNLSNQKIEKELGWKAQNDLEDMCRDSWNWQKKQS